MVVMLNWWFRAGFKNLIDYLKSSIRSAIELFSVTTLFKTLFSPFRQISAGMLPPGVPIKVQIKAAGDRFFSRFVGFFIRSGTILIAIFVILMQILFSFLVVFMWLILPLFPILGIILFVGLKTW